MYKEAQKEEFISYYLRSRVIGENTPKTIFTFTEEFEFKKDKDISTFDKEEILDVLKAKKYRSVYSAQNMLVILKHYTEYIIGTQREMISCNNFKAITKEDILFCLDSERVNSLILSRQEIDDIQNDMLNYTDKAILECLFSGIAGKQLEDLTSLNIKSLNTAKHQLRLPDGKIISISQKLCDLLVKAFNETEMVSYGETMRISKMSGKGSLYKEKANAYKLANAERKFRWVLRRVVIWRDYFGIPVLTMKTISLSGLVHAVKVGMAQNNLSLREYLKSQDGQQLATIWGFKAFDYVNVIYEKVRWYIE